MDKDRKILEEAKALHGETMEKAQNDLRLQKEALRVQQEAHRKAEQMHNDEKKRHEEEKKLRWVDSAGGEHGAAPRPRSARAWCRRGPPPSRLASP